MAALFRCEIDDNTHIGRGGAVRRRKHRVEVHLGNFRKVADQLADLLNETCEGVAIHRVAAAHPLQHFGGLDAVEHRKGILLRGRGQTEGDVLQHLD